VRLVVHARSATYKRDGVESQWHKLRGVDVEFEGRLCTGHRHVLFHGFALTLFAHVVPACRLAGSLLGVNSIAAIAGVEYLSIVRFDPFVALEHKKQ
jgi:hypothetical protein